MEYGKTFQATFRWFVALLKIRSGVARQTLQYFHIEVLEFFFA